MPIAHTLRLRRTGGRSWQLYRLNRHRNDRCGQAFEPGAGATLDLAGSAWCSFREHDRTAP
jgi:hypothetical protein